MRNIYASLIAIAESMHSDEPMLTFTDDPVIAEAFNSLIQFEVLSRHEPSRLADFDLSELGTAELEQMRYWNPRALGQPIFNR